MSILDGQGRSIEAVEHPAVDWDDFHRQLHEHASPSRPVLHCRWVRDPHGDGMVSVWVPDATTEAETL